MDKKTFNDYEKAANTVCLHCIKLSEERCKTCPVRSSLDFYRNHK